MYPELFRIGDFPINAYGVWLAIGLVAGLYVAARLAAADGISKARIYDIGLWTILGGLVGSKLLLLLTDQQVVVFSMAFLRSGGVYYGGFLGGLLTFVVLIKYYGLPFWKVGDAFAPGVALGQFFGRQGCFSAGCDWGKETLLPWGVHFTEAGHANSGVPIYGADGRDLYLHPTQLYESFAMLAVFGFLLYVHKRKGFDGKVLLYYGIAYSVIRFLIEFLRDDPRGDILGITSATGLSTSQIIGVVVAMISIALLYWKTKTARKQMI